MSCVMCSSAVAIAPIVFSINAATHKQINSLNALPVSLIFLMTRTRQKFSCQCPIICGKLLYQVQPTQLQPADLSGFGDGGQGVSAFLHLLSLLSVLLCLLAFSVVSLSFICLISSFLHQHPQLIPFPACSFLYKYRQQTGSQLFLQFLLVNQLLQRICVSANSSNRHGLILLPICTCYSHYLFSLPHQLLMPTRKPTAQLVWLTNLAKVRPGGYVWGFRAKHRLYYINFWLTH